MLYKRHFKGTAAGNVKIILQPLIETSIRHGFGLDNSSSYLDVPSIKIEVYRDDPWLYLRVIDNGAGIDIERAAQILHNRYRDGQKACYS